MPDITTIATVWVIIGFAGGLSASRVAYTFRGVIAWILVGMVLGPFSVIMSMKPPGYE